jgi:DcuC family C4-dicarboxylate transporter
MIACTLLVMLVSIASRDTIGEHLSTLTRTFFDGMGYAFATVISLIIAADCVIEGLTAVGLVEAISAALVSNPIVATIGSPLGSASLAVISGSGTAPTLLFAKGVLPSLAASMPLDYALRMAAVVGIASGIGRSMSPVAAVTVFTAALTNINPVRLALLTMWPMLAALLTLVGYALLAG